MINKINVMNDITIPIKNDLTEADEYIECLINDGDNYYVEVPIKKD